MVHRNTTLCQRLLWKENIGSHWIPAYLDVILHGTWTIFIYLWASSPVSAVGVLVDLPYEGMFTLSPLKVWIHWSCLKLNLRLKASLDIAVSRKWLSLCHTHFLCHQGFISDRCSLAWSACLLVGSLSPLLPIPRDTCPVVTLSSPGALIWCGGESVVWWPWGLGKFGGCEAWTEGDCEGRQPCSTLMILILAFCVCPDSGELCFSFSH